MIDLRKKLEKESSFLTKKQINLFVQYQQELMSFKKFFITKKNPEEQIHFLIREGVLSCSHLLKHIPVDTTIVDVGSGVGFPALVIGILSQSQERKIVMVEPSEKRSEFLKHCINILSLENFLLVKKETFKKTKAKILTMQAFTSLKDTLYLFKKFSFQEKSYHFKSHSFIQEWKELEEKEKLKWSFKIIFEYAFEGRKRIIVEIEKNKKKVYL